MAENNNTDKKSHSKNPTDQTNEIERLPEAELNHLIALLKKKPEFNDISQETLKQLLEEFFAVESSLIKREISHISQFSGPLPPPQVLANYENIGEGFADRIISMAEEQSGHRRHIEKLAVEGEDKRANRGQTFGLIISIIFIIAVVVCAYVGQPWPAAILGVGGISSLVSLFIRGKRKGE